MYDFSVLGQRLASWYYGSCCVWRAQQLLQLKHAPILAPFRLLSILFRRTPYYTMACICTATKLYSMWLQKSIITLSSSRSPFGCVHAFGENSLCRRFDCRSNAMHGNYPCNKHSIVDLITQRMPIGGQWRAAHHLVVDVHLLLHGFVLTQNVFGFIENEERQKNTYLSVNWRVKDIRRSAPRIGLVPWMAAMRR